MNIHEPRCRGIFERAIKKDDFRRGGVIHRRGIRGGVGRGGATESRIKAARREDFHFASRACPKKIYDR